MKKVILRNIFKILINYIIFVYYIMTPGNEVIFQPLLLVKVQFLEEVPWPYGLPKSASGLIITYLIMHNGHFVNY